MVEAQLAVELYVRAELDRFGFWAQEYTRWHEKYSWETYGNEGLEFVRRVYERTSLLTQTEIVGKRVRAPKGGLPVLHWYCFTNAAGLTGHLYYHVDGAVWAFAVERWWRWADARRKRRGFFCCTSTSTNDLRDVLRKGIERLNEEAREVARWAQGKRALSDAVYRLGGTPAAVRLGGNLYNSVEEALKDIGINNPDNYTNPQKHEERIRLCTECNLLRPQPPPHEAEHVVTAPDGLQWFACPYHAENPIPMRFDDLTAAQRAAHALGARVFRAQPIEDLFFAARSAERLDRYGYA